MLTIYAPFSNKNSKAWEVFNGVEKSWPDQITKLDNAVETDPVSNSMFWGFVGNNREMVQKLDARNHTYWFTDTPYFGRFDNNNLRPDNHYWRICKNNIHVPYLRDCKADRFEKFGIDNYFNHIPRNAINKTGVESEFGNFSGVTKYLQHCDFFIGLGSGLSWLSWAMKIPTILISNFSPLWYEFQTNVVRVYKDSPVSGYFTEHKFDSGNWNWCPVKEINSMQDWYDLEQITPDDVIDSIDECVVTLLK